MTEPSDVLKSSTSGPKAVGIDLGTTNSAVAWVDASGRTAMVNNADGDILTPSIVLFRDSEVVVGKEARRSTTVEPQRVAEWVKRDMGSPVFSHAIQGEFLPPEVIQACILRKLKVDLVGALGPHARVVITVPAYFDETRRKATADAGEMAGLNLLDIVNEPTAAALAFGETIGYLSPAGEVRDEMTVLVYDLGGGTFDVTLLRMAPGDVQCLATDGDVQLGGHDWDQRLVDHLAEAFKARHGVDPREDPVGLNRLFQLAVEAKHALSARSRTTARVDHAGRSLETPITRAEFEEMTADLLERTLHTTRQVLAEVKMRFGDVNRLLLVGGSTRMPIVAASLQAMTGLTPERSVNPDEAVARGAALYARYLLAKEAAGGESEPDTGFTVTNVNAHSLGIEGIDPATLRKTNVKLIPRNTPLPAALTEKFVTRSENQRSIIIRILQGENALPEECMAIGRTAVEDLPEGLPKGWPVEVTFEYESNGRLTVRAVVPGTHRETTLKLERTTGLSSEGLGHWREAVESAAGFDAFEALIQEALEEQITPLAPAPVSSPSPSQPVSPGASQPMRSAPMGPVAPLVPESLPPASGGPESDSATRDSAGWAATESYPAGPGTGVEPEPFAAAPVEVPPDHWVASRGKSGTRRWLSILVFYVTSAATGCALAYYVLSRWHPEQFPLPW